MIELRQIQLFVAAAEHLHFRNAAQTVKVSVGSLSQTISKLEDELDVRLFEREERSVRLTPAGVVFLEESRRLLEQTERSLASVKQVRDTSTAQVRIGYYPSLTAGSLSPLVSFARGPGRTIRLDDGSPSALADRLVNHDLDIIVSSRSSERRQTEAHVLGRVPLSVLVPDDHTFATVDEVAIADLATEPLVLTARLADADLFDATVAACHVAGFDARPSQVVGSPQLVLPAVGLGLGVGVVPASVSEVWMSPGVTAIPLADGPSLEVVAYRRTEAAEGESSAVEDLWGQFAA